MLSMKRATLALLVSLPALSQAGMLDDAKEQIRREREAQAIESLGYGYAQEIARYKANPNRGGPKCYLAASASWSMWTGMPKAAFEACDEAVRKEIMAIREADVQALAVAKAERAEKRKGMSEVAAKLDEIDERQQDREREMDRKEAIRQARADDIVDAQNKVDQADAKLKSAKQFSCSMGNAKDCK